MEDESRRRRDKRREEHVSSREHKYRHRHRKGDEGERARSREREDESDDYRDWRHRSRRGRSRHHEDEESDDDEHRSNRNRHGNEDSEDDYRNRRRERRARSRHADDESDEEYRSGRRDRENRARSRHAEDESDEERRSRRARSKHAEDGSDEERRNRSRHADGESDEERSNRRGRSRHEGDERDKEDGDEDHRSHRKSKRRERHHKSRKRSKHGDGGSDDEREAKHSKHEEESKDVEMQEPSESLKAVEQVQGAEKKTEFDDLDRIMEEQREKWKKAAQEQRRKKDEEEKEMEKRQESQNGKNWTLEGDESDEEEPNGDQPMATEAGGQMEADEVDPLDAYMSNMVLPEVQKLEAQEDGANGQLQKSKPIEEPESDEDYSEGGEDDIDDFMEQLKQTKAEKLQAVDHSQINYLSFRKDFYIEVKEITRMTAEEVAAYRKELELTTRGKDIPKPIKTWNQAGLSNKILEVIKRSGFEKPMPIQAQALPVIMSGRDCIGIAKTGSGKTLAFVLPMLRHIMNQPPLQQGDGPIALIMAPTRELVQQIHNDVKKFARVLGFTSIPVYGGSGVEQQINRLKRGGEIVVCTPGRMIDILCASSGKITNLRRVTYLVMDEADRMFDLGFEPQITRIVQNTRPDRQTVLFSATFPVYVEVLAKKVLHKPVDIHMGGRSIVNKDISQSVEVRPEEERFVRLLELLGEWYEKGKVLVFVNAQEKCDTLFKDLIKAGYPCLSLHGGKDQNDRESTISDFRTNVCNLLIATSVAARGLDVQDLELVVNYDVPNHYEEYVHRVGRTGRAGRKGTAVTFISQGEEKYAPDLVKALKGSDHVVPDDLKEMAEAFWKKVDQKTEQKHPSGYGGRGHKFNAEEDEARKAAKKAQAKEYGYEEDDHDDVEPASEEETGKKKATAATAAAAAAAAAGSGGVGELPAAAAAIVGAARAAAIAAALTKAATGSERHEAAVEINDFSQHARHQVTRKEALERINEITGASVTIKGKYVAPGKAPAPGERKLFLLIEGQTEVAVKRAKLEIMDILKESRANGPALPAAPLGKYHVL